MSSGDSNERDGLWLASAPGRVNLIGDHTDYTGGLVMPMAIDRWTQIRFTADDRVRLSSADEARDVDLPLHVDRPETTEPAWGKYVAGVVAELSPTRGIRGAVTTNVPIGAGLSSSAALETAVALALGFDGSALELAQLCRRAEIRASGVPCGIMDQLSIASGVAGHALMIDCHELTVTPAALPDDVDVVVQFVAHRTLVGSPYADRVDECNRAEATIGPLRLATLADADLIEDAVVRRRAQHVIGENARVREFAEALAAGSLRSAGELMAASHASMRDLYDLSNPAMERAVADMAALAGVFGVRMTGGGFGGCIVALAEREAVAPDDATHRWVVSAVGGASVAPVR